MIISVCLICQEALCNKKDIAVLLCGHVYHSECIAQWFKLNDTCPTCRKRGRKCYIRKLFFTVTDCETSSNSYNDIEQILNCQISKLRMQVSELREDLKLKSDNIRDINKYIEELNNSLNSVQKNFSNASEENKTLKANVDSLKKECNKYRDRYKILYTRNQDLTKRTSDLVMVDNFIKNSSEYIQRERTNYLENKSASEALSNALTALIHVKNAKESALNKVVQLQDQFDKSIIETSKLKSTITEFRHELTKVQQENARYQTLLDDNDHIQQQLNDSANHEILPPQQPIITTSQSNPFNISAVKQTKHEKWKLTNVLSQERYQEDNPFFQPKKPKLVTMKSLNNSTSITKIHPKRTSLLKPDKSKMTTLDSFIFKK